ncbi:E3 ubiquitin-protein ligase RNF25-like, partial [Ascaphus truei]|uniref:E3 ubiquitin-protein ligase RNF25-like n=1 Tax=Ascaphus truei TaxID=8439 RepID=UPI003F59FB23
IAVFYRFVLSITLHPATGHNVDTQYVRFTLQLLIPPQYPAEAPEISVRNPRGLCDEQILSISSTLRSLAAQGLGCPILYELIEKGKELLTCSNVPHGHCAICLYGFQENDSLTKTPCYHHFHTHCLARYSQHCYEQDHNPPPEQEIVMLVMLCPVCRENLTCDLHKLQAAPPPQHPV